MDERQFWAAIVVAVVSLAGVIAKSWRQRSVSPPPEPVGQGVLFTQLTTLAQDIHELSHDLSLYQSAHEKAARDRHDQVMNAIRRMS